MNISELKNQRIKISPRSITCRNENGKTCGVVRDVKQFKTARPAEQMKYFKAVRECGIWGNPELSDCLILVLATAQAPSPMQPFRRLLIPCRRFWTGISPPFPLQQEPMPVVW